MKQLNFFNTTLILLAAGSSKRCKGNIKKQYLLLDKNVSILDYVVNSFAKYFSKKNFILVVPIDDYDEFKNKYLSCQIIKGGVNYRQESVFNGLKITKTKYVLIHDAVRCFVDFKVLDSMMKSLDQYQAIIPFLPIKNTLKKVFLNKKQEYLVSSNVNRNEFVMVQTPQLFHYELLYRAHQTSSVNNAHDDSELILNYCGTSIKLVLGNELTFKITTYNDFLYAKYLYKNNLIKF